MFVMLEFESMAKLLWQGLMGPVRNKEDLDSFSTLSQAVSFFV